MASYTEIAIPATDSISLYTISPDTLEFVEISEVLTELESTNIFPAYILSPTDIASLEVDIISSSNLRCKILDGSKSVLDFDSVQNNNTIEILGIVAHSAHRVTLKIDIVRFDYNEGNIDLVWRH